MERRPFFSNMEFRARDSFFIDDIDDICNDIDDTCNPDEFNDKSDDSVVGEADFELIELNYKVIQEAIEAARSAALAAEAAAEAAKKAMAAASACFRAHPRYKTCESDTFGGDAKQIATLRPSQSPIAISVKQCPTWTSLEPLRFTGYVDNPNIATITNTGTTAYFTFPSGERPKLSGGPLLGQYVFEQLHFHWSIDDYTGCEHVLDGHGYACEAHFVHYNSKYGSLEAAVGHPDGLAVVGFLLQSADAPNPAFDTLVAALDRIRQANALVEISADGIAWMEQKDLYGSYVTYKGSLTTPPYNECVTWIIYEAPVDIGREQLDLFRQLESSENKLIERNVRLTQRHPPGHSVIKVEQHVKSKI